MHLQDSHLKFLIFLSNQWGTPQTSETSIKFSYALMAKSESSITYNEL